MEDVRMRMFVEKGQTPRIFFFKTLNVKLWKSGCTLWMGVHRVACDCYDGDLVCLLSGSPCSVEQSPLLPEPWPKDEVYNNYPTKYQANRPDLVSRPAKYVKGTFGGQNVEKGITKIQNTGFKPAMTPNLIYSTGLKRPWKHIFSVSFLLWVMGSYMIAQLSTKVGTVLIVSH